MHSFPVYRQTKTILNGIRNIIELAHVVISPLVSAGLRPARNRVQGAFFVLLVSFCIVYNLILAQSETVKTLRFCEKEKANSFFKGTFSP